MKRPIILHPNYCEDGQPLETLFALAKNLGADGVEVRVRRSDTPDRAQYLDQLKRLRDEYQFEWIIPGGVAANLTLPGEKERREALDSAMDFYRKAVAGLGARLFNVLTGWLQHPDPAHDFLEVELHGSAAATPYHWQWQVDGLTELGKLAHELNAQFAMETHTCYVHDLPGPTAQLIKESGSPNLGALLDYANYQLFKKPPGIEETLSTLDDKIFYVHLKNLVVLENRQRIMTSLSDGQVNNRKLLKALFATGYSGPICIEAPRRGDGEWFARQDIEYLREVLAALEVGDAA
jgi:sugar phosphate isomerase/epimerase